MPLNVKLVAAHVLPIVVSSIGWGSTPRHIDAVIHFDGEGSQSPSVPTLTGIVVKMSNNSCFSRALRRNYSFADVKDFLGDKSLKLM